MSVLRVGSGHREESRKKFRRSRHQNRSRGSEWLDEGWVEGRLGEAYGVWAAAERGKKKGRADLTPHGCLRSLRRGDHKGAVDFLEQFGPLEEPRDGIQSQTRFRVPLMRFWRMHTRFVLVAALYENLKNRIELKEAWRRVYQEHAEASQVGPVPLFWRAPRVGDPPETLYSQEFPWKPGETCENWLRRTTPRGLRQLSLNKVHSELNVQSYGLGVYWERGWETSGEVFRKTISEGRLWEMVWDLFGHDTGSLPWRHCVQCRRLFYPTRASQVYCSPREQELASKRNYAARRREEIKKRTEKKR